MKAIKKQEEEEEEEKELVRNMFKLGTGDATQLFKQSFMNDEKITENGARAGELFSLVNLSEKVIISEMAKGHFFATFKENEEGYRATSISVIVEQQSLVSMVKVIWQQEGEVTFPSMIILNKGLPVRAIRSDGIPIVQSWLLESVRFSKFAMEFLLGIDHAHIPKAFSSELLENSLVPSTQHQLINLSTLADNEKKAQNEIDARAIFYIWGEALMALLNADSKMNANGLIQGFKVTKQMVERLLLSKDLFSSDSRLKFDVISLENKINFFCGRWGFGDGLAFDFSLFYGSNGSLSTKDELETFLRNISTFIQRISGPTNMVKLGIDKFGEKIKDDEFLSASLHFFVFVLKQIIKRFAITSNDPAFQSRSILEQNGLIAAIFDGQFLDGSSFSGCFKKYNTDQLCILIESASASSSNSIEESSKRKSFEDPESLDTKKKQKIPKPQTKADSSTGKTQRSTFPCFKRLCEVSHDESECTFNHEKEIFSITRSRLMTSANRMKDGSSPSKAQVIDKIADSFVVKSTDSEEIKQEKKSNGAK